MNQYIKEVAIRRAVVNKYGSCVDNIGNLGLEEIVLGDPAERNKTRENFLSKKFEEHLNKIARGG